MNGPSSAEIVAKYLHVPIIIVNYCSMRGREELRAYYQELQYNCLVSLKTDYTW